MIFNTLIHFALGLFFILLGSICGLLYFFPSVQQDVTQYILNNTLNIAFYGLSFIVVGFALITYGIFNSKKRYYRIHSGKNTAYLDENIFKQYVDAYLLRLFPKSDISSHISLKKNKVTISVDLPYIPVGQRKALIEQVEGELSEIFSKYLGFRERCLLTISFKA